MSELGPGTGGASGETPLERMTREEAARQEHKRQLRRESKARQRQKKRDAKAAAGAAAGASDEDDAADDFVAKVKKSSNKQVDPRLREAIRCVRLSFKGWGRTLTTEERQRIELGMEGGFDYWIDERLGILVDKWGPEVALGAGMLGAGNLEIIERVEEKRRIVAGQQAGARASAAQQEAEERQRREAKG